MPEYAVPTPRRRGRPRGRSDTRERIVAAAVAEFAEFGYDGATMRSIASRAGVDSALLHHYFGTKADLFTHTVGVPMRPDLDVPEILRGPRDQVGERLVRYVLEAWDQPEVQGRGVVLLRATIGNKLATPLLSGFLARELIARVAATLEVPDAELRTCLVASQVGGLLMTRYVLRLPALTAASVDELVARIGPNLQSYLFD